MRKIFFFTLLYSALIFLLFPSCQNESEITYIAISKAKPDEFYGNYTKWVKKADSDVQIINMYELGIDSALKALELCKGLIVSGGADVYPEWYGKIADTARCGQFDRYRDTLEIRLIQKAIDLKMPLVGICRGEQIINVSLGGSLIIDIPLDHDTLIKHRQPDWQNCFHSVEVIEGSLIAKICSQNSGLVNSNHHQAIDQLSHELVVSSFSEDGIIESVEWKDASNKGFLLAVQWHPERLDTVNPDLSLPIVREFLFQAQQYKAKK